MRSPLAPKTLAVVVLALAALVGACGGSASETPFPQSASDMTMEPVVRRPKTQPSARSAPPPPKGPSVNY